MGNFYQHRLGEECEYQKIDYNKARQRHNEAKKNIKINVSTDTISPTMGKKLFFTL